MRNIFIRSLFVLGLCFSGLALADTVGLTCTAPTQNTDGSTLTDLAGFKFYRGTSPTTLTLLATVTTPATCAYSDTTGTPGQYYAATAYNAAGVESDKSASVCYKCKPKSPSNFKTQ